MRRRTRERIGGWLFVSPAVLLVCLFFGAPLGLTVWMSLHDWPLLGQPSFAGLENYGRIGDDGLVLSSLWFTTKYTVLVTIAIFGLAFGLALLVDRGGRFVALLRTSYFLPTSVGLASAALLFTALYNGQYGLLSNLAQNTGLADEPVQFLGSHDAALWSVIVMVVWKYAGFNMLVLLVALQAIPRELYEAAHTDGASWWQQMRFITLPLMRRTFALLLVLSVSGSFLAFDQFFILTNGGPSNSTLTLVYSLYRAAFTSFDLGYASALALVLMGGLLVLNVLQIAVLRRGGDA